MKNNKSKFGLLMFLLLLFFFFWLEDMALSKKYVFAWIPGQFEERSLEICQKAIRAKIQEIKIKSHDEIEVVGFTPVIKSDFDQIAIMEEMIAKKVDGIALSCMNPVNLEEVINKAVDQQIPVMCWNSDSPKSKRFTYLGKNDIEGGKKCAEVLLWFMGIEGDVAILAGMPGDISVDMRIKGFNEFIKDYPDINVVETVYCQENKEKAAQIIEETMMRYQNLKGWFFAGPWPLYCEKGSMPTWESATESIKIMNVAMGSLPVNIDLINQGYIKNYTTARLWNWGYYSIEVLYKHVSEGKEYDSYYDPLDDNNKSTCEACRSRSVEFW